MKIGLIIGRFQPFHYGHLRLINKAFEYVDYLKIGIGSSNESGTKRNPFTASERREMIKNISRNFNSNNYDIFDIPDIHNPPKWPEHVQRLVGNFSMVFTGNLEYVAKVFFKTNVSVDIIIIKRSNGISGTKIRKRFGNKNKFDNTAWELDVPPAISYIIKQSKYYKKHVK